MPIICSPGHLPTNRVGVGPCLDHVLTTCFSDSACLRDGKPFTHLHLGGSSQLSLLSSVPFPRSTHLFLQLDDSGLGIAQSLVQDLNMPPMVLACIPHCCQLHFQLFLFLQEFFVWNGGKKQNKLRQKGLSLRLIARLGLKIKTMQIAVNCCCCCRHRHCCWAAMKGE